MTELEREHAALRQENARLAQELESRRALGRIDKDRIDRLCAHVAALVNVADVARTLIANPLSWHCKERVWLAKALAALDAGEKP